MCQHLSIGLASFPCLSTSLIKALLFTRWHLKTTDTKLPGPRAMMAGCIIVTPQGMGAADGGNLSVCKKHSRFSGKDLETLKNGGDCAVMQFWWLPRWHFFFIEKKVKTCIQSRFSGLQLFLSINYIF